MAGSEQNPALAPASRRGHREPLAVTAWSLMVNTVTTSALGVIFWAVASQLYSPQQLGEDAALISAMILLSTVSQLNLSMGITRLLPQVEHRRWRPVVGAYALTAVVGTVLTGAFVTLVPRLSGAFAFLSTNPTLGLALVVAVVLWNVFALQDAVLTSARWAVAIPFENGLFGLLKIALMVGLAGGLIGHGVFAAWLIAMALLLVPVNGLIFSKVLPAGGRRGPEQRSTIVPVGERRLVTRYLATDYLAALLSQGSSALLPLLVVGVLGRADNAYFYVAFLIASAVGALAQSLSISLVVEGAYDEANVAMLARRSAARYIKFIAPAVVVLFLAAPLVLRPFGAAYVTNGTTLLRLLLAGMVAKAVVTLYLGVERVRARVRRVLAAEAATVVLVTAGSILGMRWHGLPGLGVAWLVAQLSVAVIVAPRLWTAIGGRGMSRWHVLVQQLEKGASLEDAAQAAGCTKTEALRLTSAASGAWSDLLGDVSGARILILDRAPSRAPARLAARGAIIGLADDDPVRLAARGRLFRAGGEPLVGSTDALLKQRWDVVCLDGVRLAPPLVRLATAALAPGGRLLVVADNRWSLLRLADWAVGRAAGVPTIRLRRLTGLLASGGLRHRRVYGVLRSSSSPTSSFDVDSPDAAVEVLNALASGFGRLRLALLGVLTRMARAGWSASLMPAWVVIAHSRESTAELPVVGRIGFQWTRGTRILFGEPPQELEKHYETSEEAGTEAMALTVLGRTGIDLAPRLLDRPSALSARMTWRPGRSLSVRSLSHADRRRWVLAAARSLRRIQDATRRSDGSVLVHGDYWLGNVLVVDGKVSGVIDWGSARWGNPAIDTAFLVDSLTEYCRLSLADSDDLRACRDEALAPTPSPGPVPPEPRTPTAPPAAFPSRVDLVDAGAALVSAALLVLVSLGVTGMGRTALALVFLSFVPGWAVLDYVPLAEEESRAPLAVALSLSLGTLAAVSVLWLHLWNPRVLLDVTAVICLLAVLWHLARPGRGPAARRLQAQTPVAAPRAKR